MSFVKYEPKGNIAYLIIDREKALNALNSQVLADLDAALDAVDLSEIRCLIVRGAGEKSFVAGADIAQMKELSKEEAEAEAKALAAAQFAQYGMPSVPEDMLAGYAGKILADKEQGQKIYEKLYETKVVEDVKSKVKVTEKSVSADDFAKLAQAL